MLLQKTGHPRLNTRKNSYRSSGKRKASWMIAWKKLSSPSVPVPAPALRVKTVSYTHLDVYKRQVLTHSKEKKKKFLETVEIQIGLKNYDPQKDKRFSGTVKYVVFDLSNLIPNNDSP